MAVRYSLARKKAADLLATAQVQGPPVNVGALAASIGAIIKEAPFEGKLSGMVQRNPNGTAIIGVNSKDSETRKRFTIAHEIGHLLMHADKNFHLDESFPIYLRNERSSTAEDEREIEANQFAAELLMPSRMLMGEMESAKTHIDFESGVPDEIISMLAKRYGVSVAALTFRLNNLNLLR